MTAAREQSHLNLGCSNIHVHEVSILCIAAQISTCRLKIQNAFITSDLTLLHSEWPKLHRVLAILNAIGLKVQVRRGNIAAYKEDPAQYFFSV